MFSPSGFYSKTRNLRVRPVPEMQVCLVFTPDAPKLYTLNTTAWLVLELCDGRSGKGLEAAYVGALGSTLTRKEAQSELRSIVKDLERKGIVKRRPKRVK